MNKKINIILNSIYSVTLLICFIVNLTVSKTLSWFFIVLAAMLMSFTLTSLYNYINKFKTLKISLSFLGTLILLLGIISIYNKGNWFAITISSIIFSYLVIFTPIFIKIYPIPKNIKNHNAIISYSVYLISLLGLLLIINIHTSGDWLLNTAYPIVLVSSLLPLSLIIIIRYMRINWAYKTSLSFITNAVFFLVINLYLSRLLNYEVSYKYNLTNWSDIYITGNIHLLIYTSLTIIGLMFGGVGTVINKTTYKANTITE